MRIRRRPFAPRRRHAVNPTNGATNGPTTRAERRPFAPRRGHAVNPTNGATNGPPARSERHPFAPRRSHAVNPTNGPTNGPTAPLPPRPFAPRNGPPRERRLPLNPPRMPWFAAMLLVPALAGIALALMRGVGYEIQLAGDAIYDVSAAQSLLEGKGFRIWNGEHYAHGGPLYPLIIAAASAFGADPLTAVWFINPIIFGLTGVVAAIWLRTRAQSRFVAVWAGCACALSLPLAELAAYPWSDPLFILTATLALFALDRYLDAPTARRLCLAAAFAALACLTRHVGVAIAAAAMPLIMLTAHPNLPLTAKARRAAAYAAIALAPLAAWTLRVLIETGGLGEAIIPVDFTPLGSLHRALSEPVKWALGWGIPARINEWSTATLGVPAVVGIGLPWDTETDASVLGAAIAGALSLTAAAGAAFALLRLRSQGNANPRAFAAPAAFIAAYAALIAILLPITNIELPPRYLAPLFVPALIMAALILDGFMRRPKAPPQLPPQPPQLPKEDAPPPSPKASARLFTTARAPSLAPLALAACMSLWLLPHIADTRASINKLTSRAQFHSLRFAASEARDYLTAQPPDAAPIWAIRSDRLYAMTGALGDYRRLPDALPEDPRAWAARASAEGASIVWLHADAPKITRYGVADLAALPGVKVAAALEDAVILKAAIPPSNASASDANPTLASIVEDALSIAESQSPEPSAEANADDASAFTVRITPQRNRLIYAKRRCSDADIAPPFFLRIVPANSAPPPGGYPRDIHSLDFKFKDYGFRYNEICVLARSLPDYPIAEIRTGQFTAEGALWTATVRADWLDDIGNPVASGGGFALRHNESENALTYIKNPCSQADADARVFLHITPANALDLPISRLPRGYDNLDFRFYEYGDIRGGECRAQRRLPDYPIARIKTGQFAPDAPDSAGGKIWEAVFDLGGAK